MNISRRQKIKDRGMYTLPVSAFLGSSSPLSGSFSESALLTSSFKDARDLTIQVSNVKVL